MKKKLLRVFLNGIMKCFYGREGEGITREICEVYGF
jgi:hypothetical protein